MLINKSNATDTSEDENYVSFLSAMIEKSFGVQFIL